MSGLFMYEGKAPWAVEHRPVVVGLLIITIIMFMLGSVQVVKSVRAPFTQPTGKFKTRDQLQQEEILAQKQRDTDIDGLSDFDELNIYLTSPYIPDTDSDGVSDGVEVAAGDDPNCPEGENCGPAATLVAPSKASPEAFVGSPVPGGDKSIYSNFIGLTPGLIENYDPVQIREMLRGAGVPEDVLSQFSDEQIQELFDETLAKSNPLDVLGGSATSTPSVQP